ncbi:hypothetical protein C7M84_023482 [Penaeus vannamei]|uniref:Uncharacterized protein n=1 Tax=Penaeus vannamei TaxID=6689 RepID=A0A3R7SZS1_PENVA|nr:hypothetical protein C7M84_023482 [Penaeus vannamei]
MLYVVASELSPCLLSSEIPPFNFLPVPGLCSSCPLYYPFFPPPLPPPSQLGFCNPLCNPRSLGQAFCNSPCTLHLIIWTAVTSLCIPPPPTPPPHSDLYTPTFLTGRLRSPLYLPTFSLGLLYSPPPPRLLYLTAVISLCPSPSHSDLCTLLCTPTLLAGSLRSPLYLPTFKLGLLPLWTPLSPPDFCKPPLPPLPSSLTRSSSPYNLRLQQQQRGGRSPSHGVKHKNLTISGQCWSTQLSGQIHSQSLSTRNDYQMTWEGPASDDDQYLGYSVAVGDFTGDGQEDVALGVPKGLNYTGKAQEPKKAQQGQQRVPLWKYLGQRPPATAEGPQTWQEWFEQTGFLFRPSGQEGYSRTYVWNMTRASLSRPSYGSYSVGLGEFDGVPGEDVVVGVPRGPNPAGVLTGQIALYTHNLVPLHNISGYQLGAYFGYCLGVVDFNNDGLDDIIVGSPMYTDYNDREMKYEVGRVHVLLQNNQHRFRRIVTYTGEVSKGRFGLSVTALGDINKDGFQGLLKTCDAYSS